MGVQVLGTSLSRRQKPLKYKLLGASWPALRRGVSFSGGARGAISGFERPNEVYLRIDTVQCVHIDTS